MPVCRLQILCFCYGGSPDELIVPSHPFHFYPGFHRMGTCWKRIFVDILETRLFEWVLTPLPDWIEFIRRNLDTDTPEY